MNIALIQTFYKPFDGGELELIRLIETCALLISCWKELLLLLVTI